jgi:hypothetical protein
MALPEPPIYTVREIELRAAQFLREKLGSDLEIPIDIDLLLERVHGVDLDVWPGLKANHGLLGLVARDPADGLLYVFIDEHLADSQPMRYRMTVAEELAHVLLHRNVIEQVRDPQGFRELHSHPRWYEMERNAKRLAAALLMPGSTVTQEAESLFPRLVHVCGFADAEAVKRTMAAHLAKLFEVSTQAMTIRLGEWPVRVMERVGQAIQDERDYL